MNELVNRTVTKIGRNIPGPDKKNPEYSNYWKLLTLSCGHKEEAETDLAAWRIGDDCYCDKCGELKAELRVELKAEIKELVIENWR